MNISPNEQEIILKAFDGLITAGFAYIAKIFWKVIQSVSTIPKLKSDVDGLYERLRILESKVNPK